jgi:hypothetical protein
MHKTTHNLILNLKDFKGSNTKLQHIFWCERWNQFIEIRLNINLQFNDCVFTYF